MFERGGRLLLSTWRVPFSPISIGSYALWPAKRIVKAKRAEVASFSIAKRRAFLILPFWIATLIWLTQWWFAPGRIGYIGLYVPLTIAIAYLSIISPTILLFLILKARHPGRRIAPKNKKVAVITPCVPSKESIDVIEAQLKAMTKIKYPHDNWILDEGGSRKVKKLARKYGVKYFSRKGIKKYNQMDMPFLEKTKSGNVNAWLHTVGYRKYEFFVQLDIDHLPKPNYLHKVLGHFKDDSVAWVQAPSVYHNLENWTARGAAEQDLIWNGAMQMGFYGSTAIPFIIASHCTYRTVAIKQIGGFQPTRTEDHLNAMTLASLGWKGVYLPEIIAEGEGPDTLEVYLAQQFAWAYGMFQIFLKYTPKLLGKMSWGKRLQFLYNQSWWFLGSASYFILFFTPIIALLVHRSVLNGTMYELLAHFLPATFITFCIMLWCGRTLMRPQNIRFSWRGLLLQAIQWVVVLRSILTVLLPIKPKHMVTPKGKYAFAAPSVKLYRPFIILALIGCIAVLFANLLYGVDKTTGAVPFVWTNIITMLLLCLVDINLRMKQARGAYASIKKYWLKPIATLTTIMLIFSISITTSPVIQLTAVEALSRPVKSVNIDPNMIPVNQLTNGEILQQISAKNKPLNSQVPSIGVHDPKHIYKSDTPYIRHSFVDWRNSSELAQQILISERTNATPLITLEPRGQVDGQILLHDISDGSYDNNLLEIADVLKSTSAPVYIRFAHEMDLADTYPWGNQDPQLFLTAYRHVVTYVRAHDGDSPYVKWVWSPAGVQGTADAYYPGDDVTDVVGATILYDQSWSGSFRPTFAQLSENRAWLKQYNKPLWISEFGVGNTDSTYQAQLLQEAVNQFKDYGFSSLIYVNIHDANRPDPNYTFSNPQTVSSILGIVKKQESPAIAENNSFKPVKKIQISNTNRHKDGASRLKYLLTQRPAHDLPHLKSLNNLDRLFITKAD